eukprot:TRINITY_DN1210_c0_g1_i5.p1 TRINITY_DN1210_c0_g1~~TRINITY_DN1210_c0_g1_i5.p1  ORF type:complete len:474 (+),score=59.65 TRINITY_DN1210_c0_g1_i5:41-1462(+)
MLPRLGETKERVLRQWYNLINTDETFLEFKTRLLSGRLNKYYVVDLRALLSEISTAYKPLGAEVHLVRSKSEVISQIEFFRDPTPEGLPGVITIHSVGIEQKQEEDEAWDDSEQESEEKPTPPLAPLIPPPSKVSRADKWDITSITERLSADPQLSGHQQPHSPTIRWLEKEGIAVLRHHGVKNTTYKNSLKVILSNDEYLKVANRKRTTAVHLICLTQDLRPAQWPETISLCVEAKVDARYLTVPHGSWRERDESKEWYRTTCPVDISPYISPFTKSAIIRIEADVIPQGIIIAACLVKHVGVSSIIEEAKKKLLTCSPAALPPAPVTSTDVTFDKAVVSLLDPVTLRRISIPARTPSCTHHTRFDLDTFINFCCSSRLWACPECDEPASLSRIEYDPVFNTILQAPCVRDDDSVTHIILHADGSWEPKLELKIPKETRKRSHSDIVLLSDEEVCTCTCIHPIRRTYPALDA